MKPPPRVLVVDDDEGTLRFLADSMAAAGYVVSTAHDGVGALRTLAEPDATPDIILLDLDIPRVDGLGVLAFLRGQGGEYPIPVVIVSAHHDAEHKITCLERGANDYVTKPVDALELVARVKRHLRTSKDARRWRSQSLQDSLTGLLNRRGLQQRLAEQLRAAEHDHQELAVIFLDINGFKAINDQFGHPQGDWVLQEVANITRRAVRRTDSAGRWGGDELVLGCPSLDRVGAERLIDQIRERARRAVPFPCFGIAAGIATLGEAEAHRCSVVDLIDRADKAMYRDKTEMKKRNRDDATTEDSSQPVATSRSDRDRRR
jgi:diguanylate cyclase (GGDEF)-like protein